LARLKGFQQRYFAATLRDMVQMGCSPGSLQTAHLSAGVPADGLETKPHCFLGLIAANLQDPRGAGG
jgi:hypothetical protein